MERVSSQGLWEGLRGGLENPGLTWALFLPASAPGTVWGLSMCLAAGARRCRSKGGDGARGQEGQLETLLRSEIVI